MSIEQLIKNCVPHNLSHRFVFTQEQLVWVTARNQFVFVTALWSGKSRLAFQKLVSCISSAEPVDVVVWVIEDESTLGETLSTSAPPSEWGCGCLYSGTSQSPSFIVSGLDLDRFERAVTTMLDAMHLD
jgi:hypothetical protein